MTQEEFIEGIKIAVAESSYDSIVSILSAPPGRSPSKESLKISKWYNSLPENEKEMVFKIIKESVDMTVFGFLCVLDSVKTIEPRGEKGKFELYFAKDGAKVLLNDFKDDFLHDLWNTE